METTLRQGHQVLLFASYCGGDNPQCSDWKPCADCLGMSNIFQLDSPVPATFARRLGLPSRSEEQHPQVMQQASEVRHAA